MSRAQVVRHGFGFRAREHGLGAGSERDLAVERLGIGESYMGKGWCCSLGVRREGGGWEIGF